MTVSHAVIIYIRFDFFKIENKIQSKYIAQHKFSDNLQGIFL